MHVGAVVGRADARDIDLERRQEGPQQRRGVALVNAPDAVGAALVVDAPAREAGELAHLRAAQAGAADAGGLTGGLLIPEGLDNACATVVMADQAADVRAAADRAAGIGLLDHSRAGCELGLLANEPADVRVAANRTAGV